MILRVSIVINILTEIESYPQELKRIIGIKDKDFIALVVLAE